MIGNMRAAAAGKEAFAMKPETVRYGRLIAPHDGTRCRGYSHLLTGGDAYMRWMMAPR